MRVRQLIPECPRKDPPGAACGACCADLREGSDRLNVTRWRAVGLPRLAVAASSPTNVEGAARPPQLPLTKNVLASREIAEHADAGVTGKRRNPDDHRLTCQRSQEVSHERTRSFVHDRARSWGAKGFGSMERII
jgi:hypothetical protein